MTTPGYDNSLADNIAHDADLDYPITVRLTRAEYEGLQGYARYRGRSMSDIAGTWVHRNLRAVSFLPEYTPANPRRRPREE